VPFLKDLDNYPRWVATEAAHAQVSASQTGGTSLSTDDLPAGQSFNSPHVRPRIRLKYLQAEWAAQGDHKLTLDHASEPSPPCDSILAYCALDEANIGIFCIELHRSFQVIVNVEARRRYDRDCRDRAPPNLDLRLCSWLIIITSRKTGSL
jgi:hypothetical protein